MEPEWELDGRRTWGPILVTAPALATPPANTTSSTGSVCQDAETGRRRFGRGSMPFGPTDLRRDRASSPARGNMARGPETAPWDGSHGAFPVAGQLRGRTGHCVNDIVDVNDHVAHDLNVHVIDALDDLDDGNAGDRHCPRCRLSNDVRRGNATVEWPSAELGHGGPSRVDGHFDGGLRRQQ